MLGGGRNTAARGFPPCPRLEFVKEAVAEADPVTKLTGLMKQRRRWLNGGRTQACSEHMALEAAPGLLMPGNNKSCTALTLHARCVYRMQAPSSPCCMRSATWAASGQSRVCSAGPGGSDPWEVAERRLGDSPILAGWPGPAPRPPPVCPPTRACTSFPSITGRPLICTQATPWRASWP